MTVRPRRSEQLRIDDARAPARSAPVLRAGAVLAQRRQVLRRRVALVAVEAVLRMLLVQAHAAAGRAAPWRGSTRPRSPAPGRRRSTIASDRHRQHGQPVAVDEHMLRPQAQALDRAAHRQQRGLQDIERVDLLDARLRDAAAQRLGADLVGQALALRGREQLRVGQAAGSAAVSSRITAAATTGPASGPRPASSTPAISPRRDVRSLRRRVCVSRSQDLSRSHRWRPAPCRGAAPGADGSKRSLQRRARCGSSSQAERGRGEAFGRGVVLQQLGHRRRRAAGCWAGRPTASSFWRLHPSASDRRASRRRSPSAA